MTLSAVVRRIPFTLTVAGAILVLGLATGALWSPLESKDWLADVAYGPEALADGRWWTLLTGPFFALAPWQYPWSSGSSCCCPGSPNGASARGSRQRAWSSASSSG